MEWIVASVGCIECGAAGRELLEIVAVLPTREAALAEVESMASAPGGHFSLDNAEGEVLSFSDCSYFVLPVAPAPPREADNE